MFGLLFYKLVDTRAVERCAKPMLLTGCMTSFCTIRTNTGNQVRFWYTSHNSLTLSILEGFMYDNQNRLVISGTDFGQIIGLQTSPATVHPLPAATEGIYTSREEKQKLPMKTAHN